MERPGLDSPAGHVAGSALAAVDAVAIRVVLLVLYVVWVSWPAATPPGDETPIGRVVALVVFSAMLGALAHVLWSLSVSIGCRELRWRAVLDHLLSVPLGVVLAAALVVAVHVGLVAVGRADPYGLAALSATGGFLADPARHAVLRALGLKRKAT